MTRRLILALAPVALAFAPLAHAQPAGAPPAAHGAASEMRAHHETMQKQHLDDLKIVLRLRPDQEPALAAFVAAHKPQVHTMEGRRDAYALTTPQRLEKMAEHEAEMAAGHQRMREELAKFYAALSPEQQKVFDALHRLRSPHVRRITRGGAMMGHGGGPRMIMRRHMGPDAPAPGHEPPR